MSNCFICSETWTTTKTDEQKVDIFKRKVLRKIFGPKKNRSTGLWERQTNLELRELLSEADIVATLKSKRIICAEHIWRAQDQIT